MDRLAGNAGSRPPTERSEELAEQLLSAYVTFAPRVSAPVPYLPRGCEVRVRWD
ncbi:hypothetical protein NEUTE2DRAFT_170671 [Neurospora tetrasperma FGSC 2509]|nr:hypothetical protein NEUTE2DRAFT_170671 [Neurospora tetrasperma FGSC 2509]